MAFNNGFPMNYQQSGFYQPMSMTPQIPPTNNSMVNTPAPTNSASPIWVQGEAGAKSYLVAPNNSVLLMDSEGAYFYMKSADASGMPSMKKYSYQEVDIGAVSPKQPAVDLSDYVKRDELEELIKSYVSKIKEKTK